MLGLSSSYRYLLFNGTVNMQKGVFGLSAVVRDEMQENPTNPDNVYIFMSRNRRIIKILHYERGCFVLYEKRPVCGKFRKPIYNALTKTFMIEWRDIVALTEDLVVSEIMVGKEK